MDIENKLMVTKEERDWGGWIRSMWLTDTLDFI